MSGGDVLTQAAEFAEPFEGFSAAPYRCPAGVWTIGYGSTRDADGKPVCASTPHMSREDAQELVERDMRAALEAVEGAVNVPLTDHAEAALVDFVYNVGAGNFKASTLLRKLRARDYEGAAEEFDKWDVGGGKVLAGLVRRRAAEHKLFLS